jgi:hypothetical protein
MLKGKSLQLECDQSCMDKLHKTAITVYSKVSDSLGCKPDFDEKSMTGQMFATIKQKMTGPDFCASLSEITLANVQHSEGKTRCARHTSKVAKKGAMAELASLASGTKGLKKVPESEKNLYAKNVTDSGK